MGMIRLFVQKLGSSCYIVQVVDYQVQYSKLGKSYNFVSDTILP